MSDNFWDTVDTESKDAEKTEVAATVAEDSVFTQSDAAFSTEEVPVPLAKKYSRTLSDFPVNYWDSRNDASLIIGWFNSKRGSQGKKTLDFHYFRRATEISEFDSEHDAQKFLDLALGILNEEIPVDEEIQFGGWMQDTNPQWTEEYEQSAGMWANIATAGSFTLTLIFFIVATTMFSVSLINESGRQDWPTGEAQIIEFEEWIETECGDDGCSDTQYARATFELHCLTPYSPAKTFGPEYVCGGEATEDTEMFKHEYNSGFFEHVPANYMIEHLTDAETHTVAYNPNDPSEVDLRPGFQINWEWFVPVIIPFVILLVIAKAKNVSVKSGYASIVGLMRGDIEV